MLGCSAAALLHCPNPGCEVTFAGKNEKTRNNCLRRHKLSCRFAPEGTSGRSRRGDAVSYREKRGFQRIASAHGRSAQRGGTKKKFADLESRRTIAPSGDKDNGHGRDHANAHAHDDQDDDIDTDNGIDVQPRNPRGRFAIARRDSIDTVTTSSLGGSSAAITLSMPTAGAMTPTLGRNNQILLDSTAQLVYTFHVDQQLEFVEFKAAD